MSVISTIKNVGPIASRLGGRTLLKVQKYSPEILTGIGIAGTVVSTILVAKATLKVEPIVEDLQTNLDIVNELKEASDDRPQDDKSYTKKQYLKDKTGIYVHGIVDLTKLYGGPVSLGLASIGCILAAHGIMRRRNVALVAAYQAIEKSLHQLRSQVHEKFGAEALADINHAVRTEQEEQPDGKIKTVAVLDPNLLSEYAVFFDESNDNWNREKNYNLAFLRGVQNYLNDQLKSRGHVFLNDVYDAIGIPRTSAGSVVGWVWGAEGHDSFIDFGIYDFTDERKRLFVNGQENNILLDFNVGGLIWNMI